ncbi:DUF2264 domain-containing protein [Cellulomonas fimi]|uniref:DUF2264 domain-containing protein n=1 Tax=Cellulomonas sp. RIT-PI-Y TaxID=3035297 RepID=UPI0021DA7A1A
MTATAAASDASDRRVQSPHTGWTRGTWLSLADSLLAGVRPYASEGHARITPPGPAGGYGRDVDGLEGFARTFLLAGFRLAGERGADPTHLAQWYAEGIAAGTDPHAADRWVRLDEHPQAKVEAASIALVLDLTRPWIWDRLTPRVQEQVVDYLSPAVGDPTYPRINWVWFRLVVQTFLRSVGGPWSAEDVAEDLATHDTFARADGWLSDGAERSYDHYVGWALHLYPTLWARMAGATDLRPAAARAADVTALDRYLADAVHLIGADGSPLLQGRSLVYRFAAAAPFWVGALAQVPSLSPGLLRRAASGVMRHFTEAGAPDRRGLLTLGWHGAWPRLAQSYSGPGSPYWASKGLLGLALPAEHPVWTATEEPLPIESADTLRAVRAPGWVVAGTREDGIVRVLNHGTDHAVPGATTGDSPLYASLGYSTATAPLLDEAAWTEPLDGVVTLVDAAGRVGHRTGFETLECRVDDGTVGVAASRSSTHWLVPDAVQEQHGSGLAGHAEPAGTLVVISLARGPRELRLVRVEEVARTGLRLRYGGWPVVGPTTESAVTATTVHATAGGLTSGLAVIRGGPSRSGVRQRSDASPLGDPAHVPWIDQPAATGTWSAVLVTLSRLAAVPADPVRVEVRDVPGATEVRVRWPDGVGTRSVVATRAPHD